MAKNIEWLDNFAEKYAKDMKKTASKKRQVESIIVDKEVVKNSKVGSLVKFKGKFYKVADLDYTDEIGPGVVLMEVGTEVPTGDPMSMAMGTEVTGLEQTCTVEPERARTNPGDVYDLGDIRQEEVNAADAAAAETVEVINENNSIDRTSVPGHYTAPATNGEVSTSEVEEIAEEVIETAEEVIEEPVEETIEEPTEEVVEEICDCEEDETCEDCEEVELVASRTNRILRRIMSSKRK